MTKTRRPLIFGVLALAVGFAAEAATIRSPFRRPSTTSDLKRKVMAAGQEPLEFDPSSIAALLGAGSVVTGLSIDDFPTEPGTSGRLLLQRFEVVSPDARITVTSLGGEYSLPMPPVAHFRGHIDGQRGSVVYLAAQQDKVVAYLQTRVGYIYVGPDESSAQYVLRTADSPLNDRAANNLWKCGAEDLPEPPEAPPSAPEVSLTYGSQTQPNVTSNGFKQAEVDVETDNQLYNFFGGDVNAMAAYIATLFGADNVIYDSELALHLTVHNIHTWSMPDPYVGPSTLDQLNQLGDWWHINRPISSYPRTIVHYVSGHPVSGGIAWLGVLCSADFANGSDWGGGYSLTQVYGTYPLQFWDVFATSHEMGHNVGTPHTHCYTPPIDMCYSGEPGCYVGPTSVPPGGGTIMSYCHLLPGGFSNVNLVFAQRCISDPTRMLDHINQAACLTAPPTFADVPYTNPFFHYVETVYQVGVTGGCGGGNYCPTNPVTRAQMAVFLLKSEHGSAYLPPTCTGIFPDVPCPSQFANWIEQLFHEGITGGCGGGDYCPNNPVTRAQMAAFLLKAEHGSSYTPPACTGVFPDVPCPSQFANWIEQLFHEGITGGCAGGDYCPTHPVTRAQMAVFLVKTFGLVW